ncbi:MAG: 5-(carboxyamino)imidazole ribonucleotide synthase [Acidobacteriota bacterium]
MKAILPGATIGILGSGQLGRMLALVARRLVSSIHVFSTDSKSPAWQVADREITASYEDLDAIAGFARGVDVITLEFENVSSEAASAAERYAPLRPGPEALHITQHRLREKTFLASHGFPVTRFEPITASLPAVFPFPGILKTAGFGYDGKGQIRVGGDEELRAAWARLNHQPCLLEEVVPFERELSVVAVRGLNSRFANYGVFENTHARHILDITTAPALLPARVFQDAIEITRGIFEKLGIIGTACVELFLREDGRILVNEIAPRPHNSGHLTIEACTTSQFEQQLRAVCGLPLGDTAFHSPAAMANLLGELWEGGEPNWPALLAFPEARLHLYGKAEARRGRKMGHVTALGKSGAQAAAIARAARQALLPV